MKRFVFVMMLFMAVLSHGEENRAFLSPIPLLSPSSEGYYSLKTPVTVKNIRVLELSVESKRESSSVASLLLTVRLGGNRLHVCRRDVRLSVGLNRLTVPLLIGQDASSGFVNVTRPDVPAPVDRGEMVSVGFSPFASIREFFGGNVSSSDLSRLESLRQRVTSHALHQPYVFKGVKRGGRQVPVIQFGRSPYSIVLSESARESEEYAAKELQSYIRKATSKPLPREMGVVLPIRRGCVDHHEIRLSVKDYSLSADDGFTLRVLGSGVISIEGNSQRGLLYGVYDFLEKALSIRFYNPLPFGEYVPSCDGRLILPELVDENVPALRLRQLHYCSNNTAPGHAPHMRKLYDWSVKQRYNVSIGRMPWSASERRREESLRGGAYHFPQIGIQVWISPQKYFKSHPEYFCWNRKTQSREWKRWQLCSSSPGLVQEFSRIADDFFRRHPDSIHFPMFNEDIHQWCECPECMKMVNDPKIGTDRCLKLLNAVVREIRKKHPDKQVSTFAYAETEYVPSFLKPEPGINFTFVYCNDQAELKPWESNKTPRLMKWSELTGGNVALYYYNYLHPYYPMTSVETLGPLMRSMVMLNIKNICAETPEVWAGIELYIKYLSARLSWDPWLDVKALERDFFSHLFGEGGPAMAKAFKLMHDAVESRDNLKRVSYFKRPVMRPEDLKRVDGLLSEAAVKTLGQPRASAAVHAQRRYFGMFSALSELYTRMDAFHSVSSEENYARFSEQLQACRLLTEPLILDRLYDFTRRRKLNYYQRVMDQIITRSRVKQKFSGSYDLHSQLIFWRFRTDPDLRGESERWYDAKANLSSWTSLESGKSWESQGFEDYDGFAWYATDVQISDGKKEYAVFFTGVDERAWVYLDGKFIGGHYEGEPKQLYAEPFLIKLPGNLATGRHRLVVRVQDTLGAGGLYQIPQLLRRRVSRSTSTSKD